MTPNQIIALAVFVVSMVLIMSEKVHRTAVALVGSMLLLVLHVMTFDQALSHIDFNTVGLLFGMMLFVAVAKQSGLFEYLAFKCAHASKGDPWKIMMLFMVLTAVLSAFLDNVTTVLLLGPVTLAICEVLDIDPVPFILGEILSSNIGGTGTLIGDPPNIMIGSAAGFSFLDFLAMDMPVVIVIMAGVIVAFYFMYGRHLKVSQERKDQVMQMQATIADVRLMRLSIGFLALVIVGFVAHGAFDIESAVIAIFIASLLLAVSRSDVAESLRGVEWTTLAFFMGLFIIVGALVETGTIGLLANAIIDATGGNVFQTMIVLLVASAIVSAFLDNIPFVATMIPILVAMQSSGMDVTPLWWAVSLGACLGGNGTLIGASANVVLSDISARHGHPISFIEFTKVGFPIMVATIAVACVYLVLRFPPA